MVHSEFLSESGGEVKISHIYWFLPLNRYISFLIVKKKTFNCSLFSPPKSIVQPV